MPFCRPSCALVFPEPAEEADMGHAAAGLDDLTAFLSRLTALLLRSSGEGDHSIERAAGTSARAFGGRASVVGPPRGAAHQCEARGPDAVQREHPTNAVVRQWVAGSACSTARRECDYRVHHGRVGGRWVTRQMSRMRPPSTASTRRTGTSQRAPVRPSSSISTGGADGCVIGR